jgi:hypothetical protein
MRFITAIVNFGDFVVIFRPCFSIQLSNFLNDMLAAKKMCMNFKVVQNSFLWTTWISS